MTVYEGAQNGCLCACILSTRVNWISSALAVAGKELVEENLQLLVLVHDIVFAQVVAAGGAGVHCCPKRPLQTSLRTQEARMRMGSWIFAEFAYK